MSVCVHPDRTRLDAKTWRRIWIYHEVKRVRETYQPETIERHKKRLSAATWARMLKTERFRL